MSSIKIDSVAIIGAGLSGLSLALALHQQNIPSTLYETRPLNFVQGGAIMLSPNALRVLDRLGVYARIAPKGYHFEALTFNNESHETTDVYYFGHEQLYGYKALRIGRQILIHELKSMLEERNIPIHHEMKFSHVISESPESGVTFAFADDTTLRASLLIGADGIHSAVRRYLHPSITPKYMGSAGMTSAIPIALLRLPFENYPLPVTITGKLGAFVIAPQDIDGSEVLIGRQGPFPEQDRLGWSDLTSKKEKIFEIFRRDMGEWPDMVESALENINPDTLNLWPYYAVPRLDSWISKAGRVFILGDAAHAVPPTTGQGVNQAFEDVYMLALLLGKKATLDSTALQKKLEFWQEFRKGKVDGILDLTRRMNNKRLPLVEQEKLGEGEVWSGTKDDTEQVAWLYGVDLEKVVNGLA
ncbi:hypothetical protein MMC21_007742 [Puttea exsequens]|nr:hypothetical protein [Puttea exsequens]